MATPSDKHDFAEKCTSCSGLLISDNKLIEALSIIDHIEDKNDKNINNFKKEVIKKLANTDEFASRIECPKCHCDMESYEYMYSSGLIIDRCPQCDAVWLECGKLTKINEYRKSINTKENEEKISKLMPKILDIKREVNSTFQKIKEESSIFRSGSKEEKKKD